MFLFLTTKIHENQNMLINLPRFFSSQFAKFMCFLSISQYLIAFFKTTLSSSFELLENIDRIDFVISIFGLSVKRIPKNRHPLH